MTQDKIIMDPNIKRIVLCDWDTPIYAASAMIQENPVLVTHKISKRSQEFKNKTAFREWISQDAGRSEDDYDLESNPRLVEPIANALHTVKVQVEKLEKQEWQGEIRLFMGGKGNYRKDACDYYKSSRPPKPLAWKDCYDFAVKKYADILTICDGEEAEDGVAILAWQGYQEAKKTRNRDANPYVIAHIDKDLNMVPGWHWNYNKPEEPPFWINEFQAAYAFWYQMLIGDKTDDIRGLEDIAPATRERHGIGKQRGCGPKSAEKILSTAKTEKELAELVVNAYKEYYGKDRFGGWETQLRENGLLLRMRSYEGELFDCVEHCKKLGVIR